MAYLSKSDAINKLSNGLIDNDSFAIYTSDNNFNNNTIFYTNSAKTILLPQGNYVIPSNYRSIYIQIGSNGKFSANPEFLFAATPDVSFVDQSIFNYQTKTRQSSFSITNCSLSNDVLTDSNWSTPSPSGNPKQWVVNNGFRNTSALTNINLSEMKGFDLMIYVGGNTSGYFNDFFSTSCFVHIAQDLNRQTIFVEGIYNKTYFFKQDYWFAKQNINSPTFYRRNLNILPITNQRGATKFNAHMSQYIHDIVAINRTSLRTSTRKARGVNFEQEQLDPKQYNTTTATNFGFINAVGYPDANYVTPKAESINFDAPNVVADLFFTIYGTPFNTASTTHQVQLTATLRSMFFQDFTGSYTYGEITVQYSQANPFQWICDLTTNGGNYLAKAFRTNLQTNAKIWFFNFELFTIVQDDVIAKKAILECFKVAKLDLIANNLLPIDVKIIWYAGAKSIYFSDGGFEDQFGGQPTPANYLSSPYYNDYHNYYIGNQNKSVLQRPFDQAVYDYCELYQGIAVSNYINSYNTTTYFHKMAHHYDINNKLIKERLGNNHQVNLMFLMFEYFETVAGSNWLTGVRKAANASGQPEGAKPDIPPDILQSVGAWAFGFADGNLWWNFNDWVMEFYENYAYPTAYPPENFRNNFSAMDWYYSSIAQMYQNRDILSANTEWQYVPQSKGGGQFTSGTENYPFVGWVFQRPLICAKFNVAGTEALVLAINPFNNGYTKTTTQVQLVAGQTMSIDMFGTYTTIMRVKIN